MLRSETQNKSALGSLSSRAKDLSSQVASSVQQGTDHARRKTLNLAIPHKVLSLQPAYNLSPVEDSKRIYSNNKTKLHLSPLQK
jgi:hypothetical protein